MTVRVFSLTAWERGARGVWSQITPNKIPHVNSLDYETTVQKPAVLIVPIHAEQPNIHDVFSGQMQKIQTETPTKKCLNKMRR